MAVKSKQNKSINTFDIMIKKAIFYSLVLLVVFFTVVGLLGALTYKMSAGKLCNPCLLFLWPGLLFFFTECGDQGRG
jgi:polyferredoxin